MKFPVVVTNFQPLTATPNITAGLHGQVVVITTCRRIIPITGCDESNGFGLGSFRPISKSINKKCNNWHDMGDKDGQKKLRLCNGYASARWVTIGRVEYDLSLPIDFSGGMTLPLDNGTSFSWNILLITEVRHSGEEVAHTSERRMQLLLAKEGGVTALTLQKKDYSRKVIHKKVDHLEAAMVKAFGVAASAHSGIGKLTDALTTIVGSVGIIVEGQKKLQEGQKQLQEGQKQLQEGQQNQGRVNEDMSSRVSTLENSLSTLEKQMKEMNSIRFGSVGSRKCPRGGITGGGISGDEAGGPSLVHNVRHYMEYLSKINLSLTHATGLLYDRLIDDKENWPQIARDPF
eukprot:CAMPEP_0201995266 /NCGR_PEP_ID=MMETSP0905-20130828/2775_1 /ASSEMBLY_ACC=CAM_ASM_000554 /TAXON_ID=420261 /ORGANISM="Thalassiosira antarctica, Strain CCMP982" /LENGTH=345 /DNA_ID=CAMNT_0048550335 /DNA_START=185 /DNA_END=1220 /DNA_ORIENTATION=-